MPPPPPICRLPCARYGSTDAATGPARTKRRRRSRLPLARGSTPTSIASKATTGTPRIGTAARRNPSAASRCRTSGARSSRRCSSPLRTEPEIDRLLHAVRVKRHVHTLAGAHRLIGSKQYLLDEASVFPRRDGRRFASHALGEVRHLL